MSKLCRLHQNQSRRPHPDFVSEFSSSRPPSNVITRWTPMPNADVGSGILAKLQRSESHAFDPQGVGGFQRAFVVNIRLDVVHRTCHKMALDVVYKAAFCTPGTVFDALRLRESVSNILPWAQNQQQICDIAGPEGRNPTSTPGPETLQGCLPEQTPQFPRRTPGSSVAILAQAPSAGDHPA